MSPLREGCVWAPPHDQRPKKVLRRFVLLSVVEPAGEGDLSPPVTEPQTRD